MGTHIYVYRELPISWVRLPSYYAWRKPLHYRSCVRRRFRRLKARKFHCCISDALGYKYLKNALECHSKEELRKVHQCTYSCLDLTFEGLDEIYAQFRDGDELRHG